MGQLPWKNLNVIDMSSNKLQGHLPLPPPSTVEFLISNNKLVGGLPSSICSLHSIQFLDLSSNSLSGNLPSCIGNASDGLELLNLGMNQFFGTIPLTFTKGNSLKYLNLHGNQFEGSLPHSLLNCKILEFVDVGNNKINGSFPQWLESLPELQVLILRSNRFSGPIGNPKTRFSFQQLRIIDLSSNDFTGPLPTNFFGTLVGMMDAHSDYLEYMEEYIVTNATLSSYYQYSLAMTIKGSNIELEKIQTMFIAIDFSRNYFSGEIPKSIGKLNSLKGLSLSHNKLTGTIPSSLGNLSNLEWLDLSSNELFGKIPWQLATDLNQLGFLNLSNNKLEGPIPRGPQFNTFKDDSYGGNLALCGFPLSKLCSEDAANVPTWPTQQEGEDDEHAIGFDWKVVVMGYGSGFVIGISVGYMVLTDKTIDWLVESVRGSAQRRRSVKRSKKNIHANGGIRRRN
ncbi:LRR domain containing protein [Trema orientale]|uniref:LRR domain containing protein n=1 Tax=Trema orientale TaxID=63057 RepID=A0A2P5F8H2_TREOI|nr:LRR domain containing protein [Trema orientale]